ncbi:MAG: aldehyde ferredoxin oxidoreductase family protein [Proteobacteria bacterium]|nr:aldehyde ferredoxin oxidoreductase family protein [Desulfobacteraceae bacterium]MBU3981765.1 aldehyde ferredoxin oxidoreductase family protein [Pseudomonadota bacterium]MBU4012464.1 aldehyde ferredoxin oxidoreductase family protein [Pseudomonadota bacterium]MBU4066921.1 aldehyde ferredoxin oxidoreductase family protein [Pseudomonadota bacterium]MBU4102001.1 aldehyde ferredoxin oxidoreductase family protein [Pseudomonadota bacterium]
MDGFYGRLLKVDLTNKKYSIVSIKDEIFLKYLGGKGLASYFLYKLNPEGVDPLSPDNCLIFATGPVTGSIVWGSSRYGVFTKSPQTGFYSESYAGGKVPEAIDSTGFDAIVITGKNDRPSVLEIHPQGAVFHDAGDIWGMDTFETEDTVNKRFGCKTKDKNKCGSVVIGPAAENLVRFAVIQNNYWRSAGRTGVGTVMGSKKLKAIVFKGDKRRSLFDKEKVIKLSKEIASEGKDSPFVHVYKSRGTPNMVEIMNKAKAFPTKYWSEGFYDKWPNISAEALHKQCSVKPYACPKCFIACGRMTTVLNGRHAGLKLGGPEYETIYAFGGICMIDSIEEIAYLNDICDRMGMDTITAGNLCGFTIEAARNKKIDFKIDYGDVDAIADLLEKIAKREDIGDILARGIRYAAKEWHMEDMAVHVKGLEPPGYDPRVLKGCGLAFATSDRGACHLRATFHNPELTGLIDPEVIQGKAKLFVDFEDRLTLFDAMILCRFYRGLYPWKRIGQIIHATTGLKGDKTSLQKKAAEISNIVRKFNIREGLKPEDDNLPQSLYKKLLKTGHSIKEKELKAMLKDYYKLRGWDKPYSHSL